MGSRDDRCGCGAGAPELPWVPPKSVCTSINDVICHGIPTPDRVLKEGDIINIDVTSTGGYYGDSSRMYLVGEVSRPRAGWPR